MKKLIIFDLDGTLAKSKAPLDTEMAELLTRLLTTAKVAVISGGDWPQFEKQVLAKLPQNNLLKRLSILPTCGTKFYHYTTRWEPLYAENFSKTEKELITNSLNGALAQSGITFSKLWGEQTEDRGSQITFSGLGQQAPLNEKSRWDPDFSKRAKIKAILDAKLTGFSVHMGGTTSIDITKPGIDKAYGIYKLRDILKISVLEMIFLGDALIPGGNDQPVRKTGADCIKVRDPEETKRVIEGIIACLAGVNTNK
ncbi:HAD family hydrolase [Mucilaginibacter sp. MD40]|uniref:HAD-IIB family hydrolase n=1 Tax=Mucilaginibacter sp. MD40 TaxID=2029590 RepID=UPI000BAC9904|nr:HAD-IIB family hydrolase [Mucilaginibacter sp. MD40]PAW95342.1 HAD family hydrolase [Mucilaginibacter sp. MD40]